MDALPASEYDDLVREVLDYSNTGRAIIVCLIAFVICWIVMALVLTPLFLGAAIVGSIRH